MFPVAAGPGQYLRHRKSALIAFVSCTTYKLRGQRTAIDVNVCAEADLSFLSFSELATRVIIYEVNSDLGRGRIKVELYLKEN